MSGWGKRIKQAREKAGLSQQQLADKLGAGLASVQRYEAERTTPNIDVIAAISDATGAPIEWLVTGRGVAEQKNPRLSAQAKTGVDDLVRMSLVAPDEPAQEKGAGSVHPAPQKEGTVQKFPWVKVRSLGRVVIKLDILAEGLDEHLEIPLDIQTGETSNGDDDAG